MDILEQLKSLDQRDSIAARLPVPADVKAAEEKLGMQFPPTYVRYQLEYSTILFGTYELFHLFNDGSDLDLISKVNEARAHDELEEHLLPFVMDNGDYFCFDLHSPAPEYEVVYWSHNGTTDERWKHFLDWVENCWIREGLEDDQEKE